MNFDNSTMPIFMCKTIANKNPQIIVLSIPKYFFQCTAFIFLIKMTKFNILTYNNTFAEKHNINVMVGQEMSHSNWETQVGTATGFLSNTTPDLSAGDVTTSTTTGSRVVNSIASFFGRALLLF